MKAVIEVLRVYAGDRNCVVLHNNESYPFRTIVESAMKVYSAVIERCPQAGLFVGYVPGFPGAHSQGETLDGVNRNLQEVIAMLLEDGEPILESEFVGVQNVAVA